MVDAHSLFLGYHRGLIRCCALEIRHISIADENLLGSEGSHCQKMGLSIHQYYKN